MEKLAVFIIILLSHDYIIISRQEQQLHAYYAL